MSNTDWIERDLALAVHAAREAGRRVQDLRLTGRWKDEATRADIGDQAADGYLRGLLEGRCPEDGVLSEETADSPARLSKSRVWIVDPLDGTKEFSQLRDDWAVHVALCVDGECALAAVALPATNQVLWGVALAGQRRAGIQGGGTLLSGDSPEPAKPRMVLSRSHTPEWTPKFAELLGVGEQQPMGSVGYKVARLLLGSADVYVHKKGLKEWDTCAPETIARALGWTVCKLRGDPHRYNQPDPKNHELVICRPRQKARVLDAVAKSGALET
ncbi:MAG TPA: 3'(2'),5'-bisphosphate nucleotidase CysQ [Planctomycetota bacterium]|nr:3'(2'),5'-bisphosphate nucleotidase CysQ [Planctomycetota bacterium]